MGRIQPEANRDMLVDHVAMGMFGTMLVDHVTSGRFGPNPPTLKGKLEGRKRRGKELGLRGGKNFQGMGGPAGESAIPHRDVMVNKIY